MNEAIYRTLEFIVRWGTYLTLALACAVVWLMAWHEVRAVWRNRKQK
jgi:hypothetical protein